MKPTPGKSIARRTISCSLLALAAALAATGCESPIRPTGASVESDQYYQSLIARQVLEGTYGDKIVGATFDGGVKVLPRVDSAGPATTAAASSQPSIAKASLVGLPSANLNMPEPVIGMSLQEAVARAVKHSLAIKVEAYNPGIKQSAVIAAEAAFDPVVFGQSQWNATDEPSIGSPGYGNGSVWSNQIGVRKLLPSGATAQATVGVNYRDINTDGLSALSIAGLNGLRTSYSANVGLQITQPLLRGFGTETTQANIYLAQRDVRISLSEFKQRVMQSVADVEQSYQTLILLRTNVDVLERLVVSSEQTYNLIEERKGIDATKASIAQALSALESRRADLHQAQKAYRDESDHFKTLLNDPELSIYDNALINPTDQPLQDPVVYSTAETIQTALQQRPEMTQARLQIERANIVIRVAKNDLLPKLDLTLGMQANGLSQGFDSAFSSAIDPMNAIDFAAGIKFEFPLGNREADARLAGHVFERKQAIDNFVQIAQQVVGQVKGQLRTVLSAYDEIPIRNRVREAAAAEFEGILQIEDIRPRTPEFLQLKLDSQARLAQSEQQLIQAIINYNLAIMKLEQAKGTLLEYNRISLDRPPMNPPQVDYSKLRFLDQSYVPAK